MKIFYHDNNNEKALHMMYICVQQIEEVLKKDDFYPVNYRDRLLFISNYGFRIKMNRG